MSEPRYFSNPFADVGDRTAVPDAPPVGNTVNYETGWTAPYSLATSNPASLKVSRTSENQLFYDVTLLGKQLQENGVLPWRADVEYVVDAIVMASDGVLYQARAASTGLDPTTIPDFSVWTYATELPNVGGSYSTVAPFVASTTVLTPASGTHSPQGVWKDGSYIFFVYFGLGSVNSGAMDITIADNVAMTNIPITSVQGGVFLQGGELVNGRVHGLVYHQSTGTFVLFVAAATLNSRGITALTDSITSSSVVAAATPNSVRLAALNNNFTINTGENGFYIDNDNGVIFQWIRQTPVTFDNTINSVTTSWPIPFPNNVLNVQVSTWTNNIFTMTIARVNAFTQTNITLVYQALNPAVTTGAIHVFGIGN